MILRRRGKALLAVAVAAALATLAACSGPEAAPKSDVNNALPVLSGPLHNGQLTRTIQIPGEKFAVQTAYSSEYATKNSWFITEDKSLTLSIRLVAPVPADTVVYVEHFHADVSIQATKASVNGIPQDSMDDSMHGGTDPGFLITTQYAYKTVFSIEGYSQTLISGWSYQNGQYGAGEINQERLTEKTLRNDGGATGNKFVFIYDLLVKYKGDSGFHKVAVADAFIVPTSGNPAN